ncbi:TonB-dependent receptor [candidate division KSB1 bacterium]|nr:TonB-dependent receptor [candidate division KSB1 bacterium]
MNRKSYFHLLLNAAIIFSLFIGTDAWCGITGKIRGRAVDAGTESGLPGVNIMITEVWKGDTPVKIDRQLGAATDISGDYFIIDVPPGIYSVAARMMGYSAVIHTRVKVNIDLSTIVNFRLSESVLDLGGEVVVVADRDIVKMNVTTSQIAISENILTATPANNRLENILFVQPGFDASDPVEGKFTIRGGSQIQTTFMVDGMPTFDEKLNEPYMNINQSAIKEIQTITGGFDAEYGNARSGVINIVTKEGVSSRYSGSINYRYMPPQKKHFGPDAYGEDTWEWKTFTGPLSYYPLADSTLKFPGWIELVEEYKENNDGDPDNDIFPEDAEELFKWRHRPIEYANRPDQDMDVSLSGPLPLRYVPGIGKYFENTSFFAAYKFEDMMFVYPFTRDHYWDENSILKFTTRLSPDMKLTVQGMYGELSSVVRTHSFDKAERDFMHGILTSVALGESEKYDTYYLPTIDRWRSTMGFNFKHTLSPKLFYEIIFNRMYTKYWVDNGRERDFSPVVRIGNNWYNESPRGYYNVNDDKDQPGIYNLSTDGGRNYDRSHSETVTLKGNLEWQYFKFSGMKAGFEFVYNDFLEKRGYKNTKWRDNREYRIFPKRFSGYIQNLFEFEGLIANIGMRLDYFDPAFMAIDTYTNPFALYLEQHEIYLRYNDNIIPKVETEKQLRLAPRIGVSHPLSESTKLFFNYGHFYQVPESEKLYTTTWDIVSEFADYISNPNTEMLKTVQMEVGFAQNLFNQIEIYCAGYYKDMRNEPSTVYYVNADNINIHFTTWRNNAYEDIRGFELRLQKHYGDWFTGWFTYDYRQAVKPDMLPLDPYLREAGAEVITNDPNLIDPEEGLGSPFPNVSSTPTKFRAGLDFHTPPETGPQWTGFHPLGSLMFNFFYTFQEGGEFTWNPERKPGVYNNMKWIAYQNVDLRFSKLFPKLGPVTTEFYMDVTNLMNFRYLQTGSFLGPKDWENYLYSLTPEEHRQVGVWENKDFPERGAHRRFLNPRRYYFGLRLYF